MSESSLNHHTTTHEHQSRLQRGTVLAVASIAQFMVVLDVTIINVALPQMRTALHMSASGQQWVINAYALTFAGFLMLGGRLSPAGRRLLDNCRERVDAVENTMLSGLTAAERKQLRDLLQRCADSCARSWNRSRAGGILGAGRPGWQRRAGQASLLGQTPGRPPPAYGNHRRAMDTMSHRNGHSVRLPDERDRRHGGNIRQGPDNE